MKAITLKTFGGPENFELTELPLPLAGDDEVLVQVKAIGINPVDVKTRQGKGMAGRLKEMQPIILGWDIAGVVVDPGQSKFKKGDAVFGMINFPGYGKAYAEYVNAPASQLALKPANNSIDEAAATTLAALTAWQNLHEHFQVKGGQRVLIHAASGGVGHFAVQLAKLAGAYVIGTSSAANKKMVLQFGADEHIDYKSVRFEDVVKDVDFVLDAVGGDNALRSIAVIKPGGLIISLPGALPEDVKEKAKARKVKVLNTMVRSSGADMQQLAMLLEAGKLKPHIDATYSLEEMSKAHAQIESGNTVGKVVVRV